MSQERDYGDEDTAELQHEDAIGEMFDDMQRDLDESFAFYWSIVYPGIPLAWEPRQ